MPPEVFTCPAHTVQFASIDRRLESLEEERKPLTALLARVDLALTETLPRNSARIEAIELWKAKLNGHAQAVAEAAAAGGAGQRPGDNDEEGKHRVGTDGKALAISLTPGALKWVAILTLVVAVAFVAAGSRFWETADRASALAKQHLPVTQAPPSAGAPR